MAVDSSPDGAAASGSSFGFASGGLAARGLASSFAVHSRDPGVTSGRGGASSSSISLVTPRFISITLSPPSPAIAIIPFLPVRLLPSRMRSRRARRRRRRRRPWRRGRRPVRHHPLVVFGTTPLVHDAFLLLRPVAQRVGLPQPQVEGCHLAAADLGCPPHGGLVI